MKSDVHFFAFLFGFMVIQTQALSSHSHACSKSGTHICSYAFSCMSFHYFDLFNKRDEGKVSRMLLHLHLNCTTPCVSACVHVSVCKPVCDGWRQLACAEFRHHVHKLAI